MDNRKVIWSPLKGTSQEIALMCPASTILYHGTRGGGKCLPIWTKIPTPFGWVNHGDLKTGDLVFGSDGKVISVTDVFGHHTRDVYELEFTDGSTIEASDNHLWTVTFDRGIDKKWKTIDTIEILDRCDKGYPTQLPMRNPIMYDRINLDISPYMLGLYVGDGFSTRIISKKGHSQNRVGFGSMDNESIEYAKTNGFYNSYKNESFEWVGGKKIVADSLIKLNLFGKKSIGKFIPDEILYNDVKTRLSFLQGLADADGTPTRCGARICTVSEQLQLDVLQLVRSLGGYARSSVYYPKEGMNQKLPIYNIDFSLLDMIPFRLSRKVSKYKKPTRTGWLYPKIKSVKFSKQDVVSCISVSAENSLYMATNQYIPVHNTDVQIMRFRSSVGVGYGRYFRGIITDLTYHALDDIVSKTKKYFSQFNDGAKFLSSKGDYRWVWKTGEELLLRSVSSEEDYYSLHGQEFCIHVNELVDIEGKGLIEIKDVVEGDKILTPIGYKAITKVFPIQDKECNIVYVFDKQNNIIGHQTQSIDHKLLTSKTRGFQKAKNKQSVALMSDVVGNDWFLHPYRTHESVFTKFKFNRGMIQVIPCGIKPTIDITVEDVNCYVNPLTKLVSKNCYIGVNEVSKLPSLEIIDLLSSLNRTSFVPEEHPLPDGTILPEIPMCMFLTTNPSGASRNELKKRFIDKAAPGEIFKTEAKLFNPRTQKEEIVTKTQCHIFSSWMENSKLAVEYIADLNAISDTIKRKQWLLGDWGAADDNETMFGDIWDYTTHVLKPFDIPLTWQVTRSFDWGSSAPFSVGFWAISDGCDVELRDGTTISTIRGDVFRIAEWYGAQAGSPSKGLFMISAEISKGIIERQMSLNIHDRIKPGAADNSIWDIKSGASIASEMQKPVRLDNGQTVQGIVWNRSDKGAGSRVHGWQMMRKMLEDAKRPLNSVREKPGLFVFNTCTDFIEQTPTVMRDSKNPDDLDTKGLDHIQDEARYFILSTATGARSGKTVGLG